MAIPGALFGALLAPEQGVRTLIYNGGGTQYAMSALNTGICYRFTALSTKDVKAVRLRWSSVATPGTVALRIETIDTATGKPTGELYDASYGASATYDITPSAGVQTYTFATLPTAGMTVGTEYAIVLLTTVAGTTQTLDAYIAAAALTAEYPANVLTATDGTTRSNFAEVGNAVPICSLILDDDSEECVQFVPYYSTLTNNNIYGTVAAAGKIVVPVPVVTVGFISLLRRTGTPAGDQIAKLINSAGAVVSGTTRTIDKDTAALWGSNGRALFVAFAEPVTLPVDTYYATLTSPDSANSSNCYYSASVPPLNSACRPSGYAMVTTADITANPIVWTDTNGVGTIGLVLDSIPAASGTTPAYSIGGMQSRRS